MATCKEWIRDFKRKPKWDRVGIILAIISFITGIVFGGDILVNKIIEINIDKPRFNIENSSSVGIIYKSPNSFISIKTASVSTDSCDVSRYKQRVSMNLTNYFERMTCEDETVIKTPDLKYNLYNVRLILPTRQELFLPKVLSGEDYIIAYFNEDYSDACIPHKYRIYENISENVCFNFLIGENVCQDSLSLSPGPAFLRDRYNCYEKISGETDTLSFWNPT